MEIEGGCYCGSVRYKADSAALFKGNCFCRECQYISGGAQNLVMGVKEAGFAYTKGTAKGFRRSDLDNPVTREFCPDCGTHILAKAPAMPGALMLRCRLDPRQTLRQTMRLPDIQPVQAQHGRDDPRDQPHTSTSTGRNGL